VSSEQKKNNPYRPMLFKVQSSKFKVKNIWSSATFPMAGGELPTLTLNLEP
jgi:hypothetical protein